MKHTMETKRAERLPSERPTIDFSLSGSLKELDEEAGTFLGLASVYGNTDLMQDIVDRGAFDKTIRENPEVVILWQHDPRVPIGKGRVEDSPEGLLLHGRLTLESPKAREALALMKDGVMGGLSIGYDVLDSEYDRDEDVRHLKELRLWEVSVVTFPANQAAKILRVKKVVPFQDLKLASRDVKWDPNQATQRLQVWAKSRHDEDPEQAAAEFLKGFMYRDPEEEDPYKAGKLPIAEVVDGKALAVPDALWLVAKALESGNAPVPNDAVPELKSQVDRYFQKMRSEFGDDTIRTPWDDHGKDGGDPDENKDGEKGADVVPTNLARKLTQLCADISLADIRAKAARAEGVKTDDLTPGTISILTSTKDAITALLGTLEEMSETKDQDETKDDTKDGGDPPPPKADDSAPGTDQGGDDGAKTFTWDGEPVDLDSEEGKALASLLESLESKADATDTEGDEDGMTPELQASIKAYADSLTTAE